VFPAVVVVLRNLLDQRFGEILLFHVGRDAVDVSMMIFGKSIEAIDC
jgi:hypothetical protein